jgi:hypothetical protein
LSGGVDWDQNEERAHEWGKGSTGQHIAGLALRGNAPRVYRGIWNSGPAALISGSVCQVTGV